MTMFYLFATVLVGAAIGVILSRNPVHSAMFLVLAFVTSAFLWIMLEAEFLALVLVLVYVGAVMVLFLFVVMMLDIDFAELRAGFIKNFPLGMLVALILFVELFVGIVAWNQGHITLGTADAAAAATGAESNIAAIGALLYGRYLAIFEVAGLVLLVAMIGAIVLTHRKRPDGARSHQNISRQVRRRPDEATVMKQPEVGKGIKL